MGLLKRFLSLRYKARHKRAKSDGDDSSPSPPLDPQSRCSESDAAFSRLLRSSSAHFKIISAKSDSNSLKPLPPKPTESSSARSSTTLDPPDSGRVPSISKSTYSVTIYKRQQIASTEFPNAYPPTTPHRNNGASRSTPNLLALPCGSTGNLTATTDNDDSSVTPTLLSVPDPLKYPVTPRDINRLGGLRSDPSIVSLVGMYDEKGKLNENAFANTPARTRKRKSLKDVFDMKDLPKVGVHETTFKNLLGVDSDNDADLSWAERYIANNESVSSLSTAPTLPLDSPNSVSFKPDDGTDTLSTSNFPTTHGGYEAISSMIVELSITSDDRVPSLPSLEVLKAEKYTITKDTTRIDEILSTDSERLESGNKPMERRPSQRASQVFRFIHERRERRKSQDLLTHNTTANPLPTINTKNSSHQKDLSNDGTSRRAKRRSLSSIETPTQTKNPTFGQVVPSTRHLSIQKSALKDRKKPETIREKEANDVFDNLEAEYNDLNEGHTLDKLEKNRIKNRVGRSLSAGAHHMLDSGLATESALDWRKCSSIPHTSTPHQSKISRGKKPRSSTVTGAMRPPAKEIAIKNRTDSSQRINPQLEERTYRIFAANLDSHRGTGVSYQTKDQHSRRTHRRQAKPLDMLHLYADTNGSSSELSPEATAVMADARSRKAHIRERRERRTRGVQEN